MIRAGARWRIGSGKQARIWNEPWLPDSQNLTIQTPPLQELSATVSSLMVSGGTRWEEDILNDIFDRDRDLISKTPLGLRETDDNWMWYIWIRDENLL